MQIDLDADYIRGLMTLRRSATEMKLPMKEHLKVRFITRRGELLANFILTSGAWLMMLQACRAPHPSQQASLNALRSDVLEFKEWAEEALQELQRMGLIETLEDHPDAMPQDPQLAEALRRMLEGGPVERATGARPRDRG